MTIGLCALKHLKIDLIQQCACAFVVKPSLKNGTPMPEMFGSDTSTEYREQIVICDDAHGMSEIDINNKYLQVRYIET